MGHRGVGATSIRLVDSALPICLHLCECSQRGKDWMRGKRQASSQTCSEAPHTRFLVYSVVMTGNWVLGYMNRISASYFIFHEILLTASCDTIVARCKSGQ